MDDYNDPDTVLLGGGLRATDDSFDPFEPRVRHEGEPPADSYGEAGGYIGVSGEDRQHDDAEGVIRYGRFGDETGGLDKSDDDRPLPWESPGSVHVSGADERRAREAASTGDRNIRGVAATHGGGATAGGTGDTKTHSPRVDSSIHAAGERIRAELTGPVDTRQRSAAIIAWDAAGRDFRKIEGPRRQYQKQGIVTAPQFLNTTFEAMLMGLKANASGDWILTLKIDQDAGQLVFPLHSAFGLALDIEVNRHVNRPE